MNNKAVPIKAPDGTLGYGTIPLYEFRHIPTAFNDYDLSVANELNRRGIFPKIDFADISSVDNISNISETLKSHPFVRDYRSALGRMPLDINHMY